MELVCDLPHCIKHCAITFIVVIVVTLLLDIALYLAYSYFTVRRYYSSDITQWRNRSLARYGYYEPGTTGSDWTEIYPPVDNNSKDAVLKSISVNDNWVWATAANDDVFVCRKPCDGSTQDAYWHLAPGKVRQVSVNNKTVWGVDANDVVFRMNTTNDTGKWEKTRAKLRYVGIGTTGWVWGATGKRVPYICQPKGGCFNNWYDKPGTTSVQIAVGQNYTWSLAPSGNIIVKNANGIGKWTKVAAPTPMSYIACGLTDNLFALNQEGSLYMLKNKDWILVQNAPKFKLVAIHNEIYGVGKDNTMWVGVLPVST